MTDLDDESRMKRALDLVLSDLPAEIRPLMHVTAVVDGDGELAGVVTIGSTAILPEPATLNGAHGVLTPYSYAVVRPDAGETIHEVAY